MTPLLQKVVSGFRRDKLPILLVLVFLIVAVTIRTMMGFSPLKFSSIFVNLYTVVMALILIAAFWILYRLIMVRPESPFSYLRNDPVLIATIARIPLLIPILLAQVIFMPTFSGMKLLVGKIYPYDWDQKFIDWDLAIHGDHPWILMQPVLGEAWITAFIALFYHIWILYLYLGFPLICFWQGNETRRQQMLVAYFLCWILIGVLLANYLASVGPFALQDIKGNATFVPLMDYLRQAGMIFPVLTLDVQDTLIQWHHLRDDGLGRGISAMPSIHVSVAMLFAIFGWYVSRPVGWILTAMLVMILVGSVHLGYHYAVDGYVSIIATLAVWWAAGFVVNDWSALLQSKKSINDNYQIAAERSGD